MNTKWIRIYAVLPTGEDLLDEVYYDDEGCDVDFGEGAVENILGIEDDPIDVYGEAYFDYVKKKDAFLNSIAHLAKERNEHGEVMISITVRL